MKFLFSLNAWAQRRPLLASVLSTTSKAWAADLFVQKVVEKRDRIDLRRSVLFASFAMTYQGLFQYATFNTLGTYIWPGQGLRAVVSKVIGVNFFLDPVFFFPSFYTMKELVNVNVTDGRKLEISQALSDGMKKYRQNCYQDWFNTWVMWVPGHIITFGVVPPHLRMPWVAALSFSYMCVLSFSRGDYSLPPKDSIGPADATDLTDSSLYAERSQDTRADVQVLHTPGSQRCIEALKLQ
mmetsp:Transcript_29976/g.41845  ORF Transcript_29976/g.41845 Transcript_29976/m.41845 type:complete len:239 (+) Transcript_29976:57-773(+)